MIRLLGAITGAALALASLLVLVGIPQFKADPVEVAHDVVTLPMPVAAVDEVQAPADAVHTAVDEAAFAVPPPDIENVAASTTAPAELDEDVPMGPFDEFPDADALDPLAAEPAEIVAGAMIEPFNEAMTEAMPEALDSQNWYAFWSPFRSEIAASGFVQQLQRVTGLDYRVVKTKPGVYEVAFAYDEDADIPMNLSQITAATGLEMQGN